MTFITKGCQELNEMVYLFYLIWRAGKGYPLVHQVRSTGSGLFVRRSCYTMRASSPSPRSSVLVAELS